MQRFAYPKTVNYPMVERQTFLQNVISILVGRLTIGMDMRQRQMNMDFTSTECIAKLKSYLHELGSVW